MYAVRQLSALQMGIPLRIQYNYKRCNHSRRRSRRRGMRIIGTRRAWSTMWEGTAKAHSLDTDEKLVIKHRGFAHVAVAAYTVDASCFRRTHLAISAAAGATMAFRAALQWSWPSGLRDTSRPCNYGALPRRHQLVWKSAAAGSGSRSQRAFSKHVLYLHVLLCCLLLSCFKDSISGE